MIVVVNTSPLIALDRIGCLHLLPALFGRVIRPQSVLDELVAGESRHGVSEEVLRAEWIETVEDPPEMVLRRELGDGETAVIALAVRRHAELVLLDDLSARNVAAELGLTVSGTLGIIMTARKRGLLGDIDRPIQDLVKAGFRVSDVLLRAMRGNTGS